MSDKYLRDEKQQLLNAIGTEVCWGWSPAIDLTNLIRDKSKVIEQPHHTSACEEEGIVVDNRSDNNNINDEDKQSNTKQKASTDINNKENKEFNAQRTFSSKATSVDELLQEMLGTMNVQDRKSKNTNKNKCIHDIHEQTRGKQDINDVHILLAGACDIRHILRTLSSLRLREQTHQQEHVANLHSEQQQQQQKEQEREIELSETNLATEVKNNNNNNNNDKNNNKQNGCHENVAKRQTAITNNQVRSLPSTETTSMLTSNLCNNAVDTDEEHVNEKECTRERNGEKQVYHFYVYEPNLRLHCRHLFFLQWLLDSMFALEELEERVLMFLDVYGNSCTREATAAQARSVVQRLLKALANYNNKTAISTNNKNSSDNDNINTINNSLSELISLNEMKMKERDFVQEQLVHWVRDSSQVDVSAQWARRVRHEMAERYDNRDNLIDWDFVFKLTDYTNLIKFPEYRVWRNTGIAFDVSHINPRRGFEYNYTVPNKSLCHFDRKGRGVYYGEVKNGPFYSFGTTTCNTHICRRSADGTCAYGNGVVSMHNVRSWLYTLMTGAEWPWADHHFAWDDEKYYNYLPPGTLCNTTTYHTIFPRVKFHFIGLDFDRFLIHQQQRHAALFDIAFVGISCTHLLTIPFFTNAMSSTGIVVAETAKFIIDADDDAKERYVEKIKEFASVAGWGVNDNITQALHAGQPAPRKVQGTKTPAQCTAEKRLKMPHQIALTLNTPLRN